MLSKLLQVLTPQMRRELPWMLAAFLLTAIFEVSGVAAILPFMMLVAKPELMESHTVLHQIYVFSGQPSPRVFIVAAGLGVLGTLALGNLVAAATTWFSLKSIGREHAALSEGLLTRYLSSPYSWFLQRNTAALSRNVLSEVGIIPFAIVLPLLRLLSRLLVVGLIVGGLVYLNPLVALLTSTSLGLAYGIIWSRTKGRMSSLGKDRIRVEADRYRVAAEALQGIKTTMVLGREESFLDRYRRSAKTAADIQAAQGILNELPRFLLETLAFGGVICIVLALVAQGEDLTDVLPTITVFTVGAYRLLPALQQGFSYLACIRGNLPSLDYIVEEHSHLAAEIRHLHRPAPLKLDRQIELKNVTFSYAAAGNPVVQDISLVIRRNTSIALVGSTGSGKTTLMDLLLGLHQPQSGSMQVDDVALDGNTLRGWQANVGYVSQDIFLLDDTIAANVAFGVAPESINIQAVKRALQLANLDDFVNAELADGYLTLVGERGVRLSGGQRQRIGIARALYADPQVLIFDEATSSLDSVTETSVMEAIQSLATQKTLIMVAHRLSTIQDCDIIYLLAGGRIVDSGSYHELLETSDVFRQMAKGSNADQGDPQTGAPTSVSVG
ncbi:ABC transporter ATP-binding protein [bacterium]|nr:ABC transporter ATP-binding protein [bacterium]